MNENILSEISAEYEQLRLRNHEENERRIRETSVKSPLIARLIQERSDLFHNGAREAFAHPDQAMEISARMEKRMREILSSLRDALTKAGFPEDYLQPVEHCHKCHDTGYVGEPIREKCECLLHKIQERTLTGIGTGTDKTETFSAFNEMIFTDAPASWKAGDSQRALMCRMRDHCLMYAESFPNQPKRDLLFFGTTGLGKTFLLNCIANRILERGFNVLKISAYQLGEYMRLAAIEHDTTGYQSMIDVPLLLIDDLGMEVQMNNLSGIYLFNLLSERDLANRATIISTNLNLQQLKDRYQQRIASRLLDTRNRTICEFHGNDVRVNTHAAKKS